MTCRSASGMRVVCRLLLLPLVLLALAACTAPTSTSSKVPILLHSPAANAVPANFVIYNPTLMGEDFQAEFRSDGAGHHMLLLSPEEDGKKGSVRGYLRLAALPLFPKHFIAEVSTPEETIQLLVRKTDNGFAAETVSVEEVMKQAKVPGITKNDGKYQAASLDALQTLFWRALDLSKQGKVKTGEAYDFVIYDLDRPNGRPDYDAARQAERDRKAREKARKEAAERDRLAAEKARKERQEQARIARQQAEKERRAAMLADNNKRFGSWVYRIELDPITDKQKQYAYGLPQGFDDFGNSPYLRIGCYGASDDYPMGITFFWGQPLNDVFPREQIDMARVTVRFGRGDPVELGWSVSGDWASTYPPSAFDGGLSQLSTGIVGLFAPNAAVSKMNSVWKAKELHDALRQSSTVTFRAYPRSGRDATYTFDLSGYAGAVRNFQNHCNR